MTIQERVDSKLDKFFDGSGPLFYQIYWLVNALLIPVVIFYTVCFGTKQLGPDSWEIKMPAVPIFIFLILFEVVAQRYMRRMYRQKLRTTALAYVVGCFLSVFIVCMALPGMPLESYWHAPTGGLIFLIVLPVLFYGLGYLINLYDSRKLVSKAFEE